MWCRLVLAAAFCGVANLAAAQSFDCAKAQTRVEKMVCADRAIADLDEYLGRYYAASRAEIPAAASCLQSDQAQWLKSTRDACADGACLKSAYLNRLAELDPLQPGATALKNIELPPVPGLVWVVPAALDKVAAPPNPKARPYQAVGTLLDDIGSNPDSDGIAMRLKDGTRIPLVMLMFLEAPTQERLAVLAKDRAATFRARGYAASDSTGKLFFEPSRCVFLHRLPAAPAKPAAPDAEQEKLSFDIATPFKFDRGRDQSQPFYAVMLKSAPICSLADAERTRAQQVFPRAKAQPLLALAKASGYPDANIRRLAAIVVYQIE